MIFVIAIVVYIVLRKSDLYRRLYGTVAPKLGKWATSLFGCAFCLIGWSCIVVGLVDGHTVLQIVRNWALTVIVFNLIDQ